MSEESDRRQEERAAIELKVEYHRLNTFFYDYTKNISKGGTFIKTTRPLDIGTIFLFKLFVPTFAEPLVLRGEVRWVFREGEPPPPEAPADAVDPGMGIRFMYEDDQQRETIDRVVEKMMIGSLGQHIYARLRGQSE